MANLSDLVVPESSETIESTLYVAAAADNLPTTQWQALSFPRTLFRIFSTALARSWYGVSQIANGVVLGLSSGAWLTLLASSQYNQTRLVATATVGTVRLTSASVGHTVAAGALTVATADGLKFRSTGSTVIPAGGSVDVQVQAYAVGSASNVAVGTITTMVTALSSVTVSNPAIGTTGTWITTWGTDPETDAELTERLRGQWATLSTGSPAAAYRSWALGINGITRAKLDDNAPDGPGSTRLYVDNAGLVATLQAFIDAKVPASSKCTVMAATTQSVPVGGVVTVQRAFRTSAESSIASLLLAYQLDTDIGGIVRESEVIERVMSPEGVVDFQLASSWPGTPNLQLGTNAIPVFATALSFVEV